MSQQSSSAKPKPSPTTLPRGLPRLPRRSGRGTRRLTYFLLLATLLPIIKDKLASINVSKNYRSIAISSLVLKLLDWIILILYGDVLGLDQLQFAYQPGCSTTMCTWTVVETVDYFLRNGGEVFGCMMDMSKAFDMVKHSLLFKKLLDAGLPAIFIRLLIFIYVNQFANVCWDGSFSSIFSLTNGVRQGAVLSAILYCFYVNDLFKILRRNGTGCWVNSYYFGILGYSDDSFLLAPSLDSLQEMLNICEEYAGSHNLKFSTDPDPRKCKTKCMAFVQTERPLPQVRLCGNPLPWVTHGKHLGNTIENKMNGMKMDIRTKRANYIEKNNEIIKEFSYAHPRTRNDVNRIYNNHFTGSPLWDLFCRDADMMFNTWNKSVRLMFDVPLQTHRYFLEPLAETRQLKYTLIQRFLGFISQIQNSKKILPNILLQTIKRDCRSTTGSNLRNILLLTSKDDISDLVPSDVSEMKYQPVIANDEWRISMVKELIDVKWGQAVIGNLSDNEVDDIIEDICTS